MSTLLYGINRGEVPSDEKTVRSTVTVVSNDEPVAMQEHSPDFNETDTDPDTGGGLTTRQLASHVRPTERYAPSTGDSNVDHNAIVNTQVSSSGTAAAKELTGQWGHGTLSITEGLEPVLVDGHAFTEDYFKAPERSPQADVTDYMTASTNGDPGTTSQAQATGEANARQAVEASQYAAFNHAMTGL